MERIAQAREWPKDWVGGQVMHLRTFHTVLGEPSLLKLPFEVIAAVFKHMAEAFIAVWILKVVKDVPP
jgi:hypothetical protein